MGVIEKQSIQDIADAIRDRNGLTTLYKPRQMDEAIRGLYKTEAVNHIFDNLTISTTAQGSSITITDADTTKQAEITEIRGNSSVVTGDNNIVVSNKNLESSYRVDLGGKNLFNTQNQTTTWRTTVISKTDNEIIIKPTANGSAYAEYRVDNIKANTQYTISYNAEITGATSFTQRLLLRLREGNTNITSYPLSGNTTTYTFTTTANTDNFLLLFYSMNGTDTTWEDIECTYSNIMLCEGTDTEYSPYTDNPIELTEQDKLWNNNGTWQLNDTAITDTYLLEQLQALNNIELYEDLCYVDWVGNEKADMSLLYYVDGEKILEEIRKE